MSIAARFRLFSLIVLLALAAAGCRDAPTPTAELPPLLEAAVATPAPPESAVVTTPSTAPTDTPPTPTGAPAPTATAALSPTPFYDGPLSPACGQILPPLPAASAADVDLSPTAATLAALRARVPAAAWPAVQRLLAAPGSVALVAYQPGQADGGVFWNADTPMPVASVAKVITLVAYSEAVAGGALNPLEQVALADLERFYLPNFDLGAHRRALADLRETGRVLAPDSDAPAVLLSDVAYMMVRHSSNAAADYLYQRLGPATIEETAVALGMADPPASHSAPCSFLGQFLVMANHTRGSASDRAALDAYLDGGDEGALAYGRDAALLADAFSGSAAFREAETRWRSDTRRPSIEVQRYFAANLAPQGTARQYATLMARLAQNGLSTPDSSYLARRYLEWPNVFEGNQEVFSNLGYKNGSLPGVLATVYYAYRWADGAPAVVALFYRDLPQQTYRQWRNSLPHDELARWLLADPETVRLLAQAVRESAAP